MTDYLWFKHTYYDINFMKNSTMHTKLMLRYGHFKF